LVCKLLGEYLALANRSRGRQSGQAWVSFDIEHGHQNEKQNQEQTKRKTKAKKDW
jgi:hypothetical protein